MSNNREKDKRSIQDENLYIKTLGDFTLSYNDKILSGDKVHSKQVWNLLEYLIINKNKDNSLDKLIDILWCDDEIHNPSNALKNLAYRLRNILNEKLGIKASDYILSKHGSYSWNINAKYIIDADIFENTIKSINAKYMSEDEVLNKYIYAINMYNGSFMPQSAYKEWVRPLSIYYQNLYMEAVDKACEILLNRFEYAKVEEICTNAISFDTSFEINHANLIKALVGLNNNKKALEHYDYITKVFYDEFGIKPSNLITDLYSDITDKKFGYEKNLSMIKKDLREDANVIGAMRCNYETFKAIYRLKARAASRSGKSVFIALLTIKPKVSITYFENKLEEILDSVLEVICSLLRKDDVVARCGRTQFAIMLSNITYENTAIVLNRLNNAFSKNNVNKYVEVKAEIETLEPVDLEA